MSEENTIHAQLHNPIILRGLEVSEHFKDEIISLGLLLKFRREFHENHIIPELPYLGRLVCFPFANMDFPGESECQSVCTTQLM